MGKYRFERVNTGTTDARTNVISFDSSPKGSICRQYGYQPEGFRLQETRRTSTEVTYDVYARSSPSDERARKIGVMTEVTDEELMRRFG